MSKRFRQLLGVGLLLCFICIVPAAAQSTSTNYSVNEYFFGIGGELDPSSTNYRGRQSAGELGVGNSTSTNFQGQGGFTTTAEPFLEFNVTGGGVDLGYMNTGSVTTTTTTFTVRAYLASGYTVINASDPPKNGTYTLTALTTGGTSTPGTEQFGINLVDNSSPNIGADPVQTLNDNTIGFGAAAANYATANTFRYNKNEVIASSSRSSGITTYTVSYIYNISNTTPAGAFTFTHDMVCIPIY